MSHATETARGRRTFSRSILIVLVLSVAACGSGPVGRAEGRWEAAGVEAYRLHLQEFRSVWCLYEVDLEVRDGQIVSATVTASPGPAQDCHQYTQGVIESPISLPVEEAPAYWTVPGMFEIAHDWQDQAGRKGLRVELEFDTELGYPRRIHRDDEAAMDDDWGLSITDFQVLPGGTAE